MTKCPYCGRTLREHEKYCDFCEQDITKHVEKEEAPKVKNDFKADIEKIKNFLINLKKKLQKKNE